jgi:hypothetical protein
MSYTSGITPNDIEISNRLSFIIVVAASIGFAYVIGIWILGYLP